jgi:NTE family protein
VLLGRWTLDYSPMFVAMDMMARVFSPYDLSPSGANPLRNILAEVVDFDRLTQAPIKLFVTATNVRTGRGRVFRNSEITPDVLLRRPACRPCSRHRDRRRELLGRRLFRQSDHHPAGTRMPLARYDPRADQSVERAGSPRSARDILNRLNEVSFNAVLLKELRMIALLRQVAHSNDCESAKWADMRIHASPARSWSDLVIPSKLNAEWEFLSMLRDEGRRAAQAFLTDHHEDLGRRSSLDLDELLEGV